MPTPSHCSSVESALVSSGPSLQAGVLTAIGAVKGVDDVTSGAIAAPGVIPTTELTGLVTGDHVSYGSGGIHDVVSTLAPVKDSVTVHFEYLDWFTPGRVRRQGEGCRTALRPSLPTQRIPSCNLVATTSRLLGNA